MPAQDAPLRALGGMSSNIGSGFGWGVPGDETEHVPDLVWPASVATLSRMRTDGVISSILAAYTSPLLAADWRIDPRGADPLAVKICADSLGLPILGEKVDDIGPARRQGVKFLEHVRLAALHLVWGHFAFEDVYEIRPDGLTYLAALPERMPSTIVEIRVNPDGTLKSIVQEGMQGQGTNSFNGVEIPAKQLLWYCHSREGANYVGRSLLRAAYSYWLLKIEGMRANAVGLSRFSAGTPVAEPLPGTNPTQVQITEAQRMVSSIRVGQQGGAVPVGFKLRIIGIEGTLPDALATLRYYDEQVARSTLTSILDLGSTANGSRALGDNFADLLQRSLQSIANQMAETASQLCVRLTRYNFGDDAVAPVITAGDVGASKATIAQSITGLIQAGAITPDPALESFVREAYHLPAAVPVTAPKEGPTDGTEALKGSKTAASRVWPPPGAFKLTDEVAISGPRIVNAADAKTYRDPTEAEQAAGIDPQAIDAEHDTLVAEGLALFAAVVIAWGAALAAQIMAALVAGSLVALARLKLKTADAVEALQLVMHEAAATGVRQVLDETGRAGADHGLAPDDVTVNTAELDELAEALAEHTASVVAGTAGREAQRLGTALDEAEVDAVIAQVLTPGPVPQMVSEAVARAMAGGRVEAMEAVIAATPGIEWEISASAVRDPGTCDRCEENDGHVYPDLATGRADFPLGLYKACLGRTRCRCLLIARPKAPQ